MYYTTTEYVPQKQSKISLFFLSRQHTHSASTKVSFLLHYSVTFQITEKVSYNIASEASYIYILSGQQLIKNAKNGYILASFWNPEACGQTVLPDRSVLIGQKLAENGKIQKFKCDILRHF